MISKESEVVVQEAESIYQASLKSLLEPTHTDEFVAIEPASGDHFLGATVSEAIGAARRAHPDRLVHCIRVGHPAAVHFGASLS